MDRLSRSWVSFMGSLKQNLGELFWWGHLCIWKGLDEMTLKSSFWHLQSIPGTHLQGLLPTHIHKATRQTHMHLGVSHLVCGICTTEELSLICVSQFDCNIIRGYLAIWLPLTPVLWSACCFQLGLVVLSSFHFLNSKAITIQEAKARPMTKPPCW